MPHAPLDLLAAPILQLDARVAADVELALDGLLRHGEPLGERVPPPGATSSQEPPVVALRLPRADAERACTAGGLALTDEESTPVAVLRDVRLQGGDEETVEGVLERGRAAEAGLGRDLRRGRADAGPRDAAGPTVVVLGRPPLHADLVELPAGGSTVLVVPVAGPSPDGVPAEVLLRIARQVAGERGGGVVAASIAWRDPDSDEALAGHVAAGLGASRLVHLRPAGAASADSPAAPGDADWAAVLQALREGTEPPQLAAPATLAELALWRPPRATRGLVVLFTGLSGSGKSTLARALAAQLTEAGDRTVSLLDGDVVRRLLSSGLGFSADDRDLNVRRIGFVAAEVARHGGVAICAPIAPYARSRAAVRRMVEEVGDLVLVHVSTPLEECERRDLKGLYARARAGQVAAFTGISDPYEEPEDADLRVDTSRLEPADALAAVVDHLTVGGWIPATDRAAED